MVPVCSLTEKDPFPRRRKWIQTPIPPQPSPHQATRRIAKMASSERATKVQEADTLEGEMAPNVSTVHNMVTYPRTVPIKPFSPVIFVEGQIIKGVAVQRKYAIIVGALDTCLG